MKRLFGLTISVAAFLTTLAAQSDIVPGSSGPPPCPPETPSTALLRSMLSSANENSAPNTPATAPITIRVHQSAQLNLYAVDFIADYHFSGPATITGFQIRSGAAGQTGAVALDSGISSAAPIVAQSGSGTIQLQITAVRAGNTVLGQILNNPGQYYAEIQTAASPNGAMRGQLATAQQSVALALLDQLNETPPAPAAGAATGSVAATVTADATGSFTTAELTFDVAYAFPTAQAVTGLELRAGPAGAAGSVIVSLGIANPQPVTGGSIHMRAEMDLTQPAVAAAVNALFIDSSGYYLNLTTTSAPSGAVRGQLLRASRAQLGAQINATQVCLQNRAEAALTFDVLRSAAGDIQAALVTFDGDFVLPPNNSLNYFGILGDVLHTSLSASNTMPSASGMGNVYESVLASSGISLKQVANMLLGVRETVQMQTSVTYSGVAPTFNVAGPLAISNILSGAGDPTAPIAAPGGLIAIFGGFPGGLPDSVPANVTGLYNQGWPTSLNGAWVTIGGRPIPVGYHSSTQLDVQVPADLAPGTYEVRYWASGQLPSLGVSSQDQPDYRSDPYLLNVLPQAPAIFVTPAGPVVTHASTGALVSRSAPSVAGEYVLIYATGIAGTSPAISAAIGGKSAQASLVAVPGFTGLQLVSVLVPTGLSGAQSLTIQVGGTSSNSVQLIVQ